jgi:hypothetical protein
MLTFQMSNSDATAQNGFNAIYACRKTLKLPVPTVHCESIIQSKVDAKTDLAH